MAQLRIYDFYKKVLRLLITLNKTSVKIQNKSWFFLAEYLILALFALYLEPPAFLLAQHQKVK